MTKITIRDIAKFLEVHHSTVSRALKNDRRLPEKTRELVHQAAKQLGYQPDPMLSALMAYRSRKLIVRDKVTLAWVTNYPTREGWRHFERNAYFIGASRRATELGYTIEPFWLHEPGVTPRRASQVLFNRNIQGLLFIPQPRSRAHLDLNWAKFCAVAFGRTVARPRLHNVDNDHFASITILMRHLKRKGYRRIAFAIWPRIHESTDRAWAAAYWAFQCVAPQKQIPVYMENDPWKRTHFEKWMKKYQPDVLISHSDIAYQWTLEMGLDIPKDIGFALTAKHEEFHKLYSGIDENNELVGETAVNVLVQMIHRGEYDIPKIPISTLIEGSWIEGSTLRRINLT